ncbi:MAG: dihydropteroate synthase [Desulfuromonadales bacterium]|nr:dihydropteroate synthase [Desulfuromonadales bacterium]
MSSFPARALHIATPLDAERELRRIKVDSGGIALMASKMLTRCVKLTGLQCRQANILKQEMLALGGDAAVARGTVACSIEKTDVILIGTDKQLHRLCSKLAPQPFGLPALAGELKQILMSAAQRPGFWRIRQQQLSLERPLIMGILNVTPDSFSDGNQFFDPQRAIERAREMIAEGADIIDIGGESTRPGAAPVSTDDELKRVLPVIRGLACVSSCPISIDTWKSPVARAAIDAGAAIINDISGFNLDPRMASVAAESGAGVVLMHTRGTPQTMQSDTAYDDLISEVILSLRGSVEQACQAGIDLNRIAVDPGIGFAKDTGQNLEILRRLSEFTCLGLPILVGTSRKAFIGRILNRDSGDRIQGTAATVTHAICNGADILRVHDVRQMRDAADMARAIMTKD